MVRWLLVLALACPACSAGPPPSAQPSEPTAQPSEPSGPTAQPTEPTAQPSEPTAQPSGPDPLPAPSDHAAPPGRIRLSLSASCRDADPCKWSRGDLFLTVRLGNTSDVPIEVPMDFLRRRGPAIQLVDTRTGATLQIRTNPPPGHLAERRVTIPPGGAEPLEWLLHDVEIAHFGRPVDLTARITLQGDMRVAGEKVPFEATTTLEIRE